jgi:hypothetical protein
MMQQAARDCPVTSPVRLCKLALASGGLLPTCAYCGLATTALRLPLIISAQILPRT